VLVASSYGNRLDSIQSGSANLTALDPAPGHGPSPLHDEFLGIVAQTCGEGDA